MAGTVVLADDEPAVRQYVRTILRNEGFEVWDASDGMEALERVRQLDGSVGLLVTDIRMPRMDGPALAEAVMREYPGIPILFISGFWLDVDQEQRRFPDRPCGYIRKPFVPKALLEAVRKCLAPSEKPTGIPA